MAYSVLNDARIGCSSCHGVGYTFVSHGDTQGMVTCVMCGGTGQVLSSELLAKLMAAYAAGRNEGLNEAAAVFESFAQQQDRNNTTFSGLLLGCAFAISVCQALVREVPHDV